MKILFFSHYFPPEGNAPATRVHALAKQWVGMGHEVTVVTCAPNVPDGKVYEGYRNRWRQCEAVDGIQVIRVWTYIAANKGTILRIANFISYLWSAFWVGLFVRRPDVVIATSPQFFCGWAGLLVAKTRRLPFVLEIRDIWPESILAVGAKLPRACIGILEWMERRMYGGAQHIVAVGEGYREKLIEKGVAANQIDVVMNGVDPDVFFPGAVDRGFSREWNPDGKFVCSYIGTIGMACGLEVVLRAAEKLKIDGVDDVLFLLVGSGARQESLKEEAERKSLGNIVTFAGLQPKTSMKDFVALSDVILVHLRRTDLFKTVMPSKIFEALAMERPVVLGVEGQAAGFIQTAEAGLCIEPENEFQLLDALTQMKSEPTLRTKMGSDGREYVLAHYTHDKLAERYICVLEKCLGADK